MDGIVMVVRWKEGGKEDGWRTRMLKANLLKVFLHPSISPYSPTNLFEHLSSLMFMYCYFLYKMLVKGKGVSKWIAFIYIIFFSQSNWTFYAAAVRRPLVILNLFLCRSQYKWSHKEQETLLLVLLFFLLTLIVREYLSPPPPVQNTNEIFLWEMEWRMVVD